jgi:mono/diheme cytochrome c family protein
MIQAGTAAPYPAAVVNIIANSSVRSSPAWQVMLALAIIVLLVAGIVIGLWWQRTHDPYVRDVLALEGQVEQGHAIFQINCAGCHGLEAKGLVGPDLWDVSHRKSQIGLIQQVTSGQTPPMPKFQPNPQEMADLLSYLESLQKTR